MKKRINELSTALRAARESSDLKQILESSCSQLAQIFGPGAGCVFFHFNPADRSLRAGERYPTAFFGEAEPKCFVPAGTLKRMFKDEEFLNFIKKATYMNRKPLMSGGEWKFQLLKLRDAEFGLWAFYTRNWDGEDQDWLEVFSEGISAHLEEARVRKQFEEARIHDPITGLYQLKYFRERMNEELNLARRLEHSLSLLYLRIDQAQVTQNLEEKSAELIREHFRSTDIACRVGPGAYAVLLTHTSLAHALQKAQSFSEIYKSAVSLTLSIGVSEYPSHAHNRDEIFELAELIAKQNTDGKVSLAETKAGHIAAFAPRSIRSSEAPTN